MGVAKYHLSLFPLFDFFFKTSPPPLICCRGAQYDTLSRILHRYCRRYQKELAKKNDALFTLDCSGAATCISSRRGYFPRGVGGTLNDSPSILGAAGQITEHEHTISIQKRRYIEANAREAQTYRSRIRTV